MFGREARSVENPSINDRRAGAKRLLRACVFADIFPTSLQVYRVRNLAEQCNMYRSCSSSLNLGINSS